MTLTICSKLWAGLVSFITAMKLSHGYNTGDRSQSQKKKMEMGKGTEKEKEKEKEKERERLCKRCKQTFIPSANNSSACRFHPSFFVCRRHDDQKRYYELGPDDPPYEAKFYDCCGAEDPDAPGCTTSIHLSYDD